MSALSTYPAEVRDGAVRMVNEPALAVRAGCWLVGEQVGVNKSTLRDGVKRNRVDSGEAPGVASGDQQRVMDLEKEVRELCRAHEVLGKASAYFAQAELDCR